MLSCRDWAREILWRQSRSTKIEDVHVYTLPNTVKVNGYCSMTFHTCKISSQTGLRKFFLFGSSSATEHSQTFQISKEVINMYTRDIFLLEISKSGIQSSNKKYYEFSIHSVPLISHKQLSKSSKSSKCFSQDNNQCRNNLSKYQTRNIMCSQHKEAPDISQAQSN